MSLACRLGRCFGILRIQRCPPDTRTTAIPFYITPSNISHKNLTQLLRLNLLQFCGLHRLNEGEGARPSPLLFYDF